MKYKIKMTNVINIKNAPRDWKINKQYAYIGRGSLFGNPYKINRYTTREESIKLFKDYFFNKITVDKNFRDNVESLKDKTLVCFCKPKDCHGDVIIDYLDN